jgi:hypothetical protein
MPLEVSFEGAGKPSPFLRHVLVGGVTSSFLREWDETGARVYQEDMLQTAAKPINTFTASYLNTQGR